MPKIIPPKVYFKFNETDPLNFIPHLITLNFGKNITSNPKKKLMYEEIIISCHGFKYTWLLER